MSLYEGIDKIVPALKSFIGHELSEVCIVLYAQSGEVKSWDMVRPELVFQNRVIRVDVKGGDYLAIYDDPWEDPFVHMSKANFDFVMKAGKHWKVNMSSEDLYSEMIRKRLEKIVLIRGPFDNLAGVEFYFEGSVATAFVGGDEVWFYPFQCRDKLADMGYTIGKLITA